MDRIREELYSVVEEIQPATVRQVFYQLVSRGVIEKTEAEYNSTVVRLLTTMRREKEIPFDWIADNTRWMRKPKTYSSLRGMLEQSTRFYRRALWDNQDAYVEVWLEKEALAGVIYDVTWEWDVPLMVTRGYPSLSFLYGAAEAIGAQRKPAHLYYLGDYDPSGLDIPRVVEQGIRELAPLAEIHFQRVAVTEDQIKQLGLQTRPTKQSDTRSQGFGKQSVELDAIKPDILRKLVEKCIGQHIDQWRLQQLRKVEAQERETLSMLPDVVRHMRA